MSAHPNPASRQWLTSSNRSFIVGMVVESEWHREGRHSRNLLFFSFAAIIVDRIEENISKIRSYYERQHQSRIDIQRFTLSRQIDSRSKQVFVLQHRLHRLASKLHQFNSCLWLSAINYSCKLLLDQLHSDLSAVLVKEVLLFKELRSLE